MKFLLGKGVWADAFDGRDDAPLHLAARQGQLHAVQACLLWVQTVAEKAM